jgi:membrane protein involved in colicin uptake
MFARITLLALTLLLAGCDIAALLADPKVAQREADAKAIGGACRHGLRSIEDCYALNEKASKAAVYAGWKEMDQYMRDNKIEGVAPVGVKASGPAEEIITESKADKASEDAPKAKAKAKPSEKTEKTEKVEKRPATTPAAKPQG